MIKNYKTLLIIKKILFLVSLLFSFTQIMPQHMVLAKEVEVDYGRGPSELIFINHPDNNQSPDPPPENNIKIISSLPENESLPYYETYITATAYTSRESETDGSPYLAAWGDHVFWGMIASNAFSKGTKIQIPDYFGNKMFSILDRMNERYYYRIDVWMDDLNNATSWGAKYIKIRVYK